MDSLIRNHPFIDSVKRTGITAAAMFSHMNGFGLEISNDKLELFTLEAAQSQHSIDEIADWFQAHTVPVDDSLQNEGEGRIGLRLRRPAGDLVDKFNA